MERTKIGNGNDDNVQPIPDINPNINPDVNPDVNVGDVVPDINVGNKSASKKPTKHKYGEYSHVLLTDEEIEKLDSDYGASMRVKAIKFLDEYIEMKGYRAKNHYLAIRKWVIDAVNEQERKQGRQQGGRLDFIDDIQL